MTGTDKQQLPDKGRTWCVPTKILNQLFVPLVRACYVCLCSNDNIRRVEDSKAVVICYVPSFQYVTWLLFTTPCLAALRRNLLLPCSGQISLAAFGVDCCLHASRYDGQLRIHFVKLRSHDLLYLTNKEGTCVWTITRHVTWPSTLVLGTRSQ